MTTVWPKSVDRPAEQIEDAGRSTCESRLPVGSSAKTTAGRVIKRPRDRDALLLAAGELARADGCGDRRGRPSRAAGRARLGRSSVPGDPDRQRDVLLGVEDRDEVEELKDEAELLAAQLGHPLVVEAGHLGPVDPGAGRRSGGRGRRADASASTCRSPTGRRSRSAGPPESRGRRRSARGRRPRPRRRCGRVRGT